MYTLLAYLASAAGFHFLMLIFMAIAVATRKFRYYLIGAVIQLLPFAGVYMNPYFDDTLRSVYVIMYFVFLIGFAMIVATPKKQKSPSKTTPQEMQITTKTEENNK